MQGGGAPSACARGPWGFCSPHNNAACAETAAASSRPFATPKETPKPLCSSGWVSEGPWPAAAVAAAADAVPASPQPPDRLLLLLLLLLLLGLLLPAALVCLEASEGMSTEDREVYELFCVSPCLGERSSAAAFAAAAAVAAAPCVCRFGAAARCGAKGNNRGRTGDSQRAEKNP